jgi:hypothetical protein
MARVLRVFLIFFTACATPLGGNLTALKGIRPHEAPTKEARVPPVLVGDWATPGDSTRLRFDSGGRLSAVQSFPFTLDGPTLRRGPETYTRLAGSGGLPGVWRTSFSEGEWLEMTLGAGGFCEFLWSDGMRGTASAVVEGEQLTIIDHHADFECDGQTLHIRPAKGEPPFSVRWSVVGDELTLTMSDGPHTWKRTSLY